MSTRKKDKSKTPAAALDTINGEPPDNAERKRAEEALKESEERFRIAAETSNDVVYEWDLKQSVKWFGKIDEMLGYNPGEFPRTLDGFGAAVHPDDWVRVMAAVQAHLEGRAPYAEEYRAIRKDGTFRWWSARGMVTRTLDGKPILWVGTVTDITDRKLAEVKLQESEENYRTLVENLPQKICLKDRHSVYVSANENFAKDLKISKDAIVGMTDYDFFPRELADKYREDDARIMDAGITTNIEEKYIQDGRYVWVQTVKIPIRDTQGEVNGILVIFWDITERKQMEEALRISKDRLLFATEGAKLGVWNWDTVTGELIWSDKCKALFGIPLNETMSYPRFSDALHPDDREMTDKAVKDALDNHTDYNIEYRSLWPDGSIHWLAAKGRGFYDAMGKAIRLEGVVLDISERKLAEEAMQKTLNDLERSNKELEQFAYVASHDLQEPLRMISSFTQLLAKRYKGKLDKDADEFIKYTVDSANRMQIMIQDLLTYSRITTRGNPFTSVDVNSALGQAVSNLSMAIRENGALVTNDELPTVTADHSQLVQLFQNLIANAVKFHGEEPPRIHISAIKIGEVWEFSVRDNGIGIEPQYFERIFVIFQRLHPGNTYQGTGIGLALCNSIVQRHGGKIWVNSNPGKGSIFYFTLKNKEL